MKRFLLVTLVVLGLSGCGSVELSSRGKDVQLLGGFPGNERPENFIEVQTISCSQGYNGRQPNTNIISCRNELRNKAAELGADFVIVENQQIGQGGGAGYISNGTGYFVSGCPNCISMVGTAYKRK